MKKALKIKLAVVLYIIYWWLTINYLTIPALISPELPLLDKVFWYFMAICATTFPIVRIVNLLVDLVINVPLTKDEQEYYGIDGIDGPLTEPSAWIACLASSLFWTPTFLNFIIHPYQGNYDYVLYIGFFKFFIVAFLFYCIDELLVEVLKKRLPKANN